MEPEKTEYIVKAILSRYIYLIWFYFIRVYFIRVCMYVQNVQFISESTVMFSILLTAALYHGHESKSSLGTDRCIWVYPTENSGLGTNTNNVKKKGE